MIAAEYEQQPAAEVPDIDAYEHRVTKRKARAIACGMASRKDKKAAAHYLIKTIKVAMATAPKRPWDGETGKGNSDV